MARTIGRLTTLKVERTKKPGMLADGGGLNLQITESGAKSWIYRYTLNGRAREMGLGPLSTIGLADARTRAAECRRLRHDGIDPIEARKASRGQAALDAAKAITFKAAAAAYIAAHQKGWGNAKHAAQWTTTLARYAEPVLGALPVEAIDAGLVLKVLEPIWTEKPETAGRLRGRIEAVLDWATARGYRRGDNPARWKGHLDQTLPARSKVQKVKHHSALAYDEMPEFMAALPQQEGIAALALEFTILTAARTGETIGAVWDEINVADKVWIVPAERMKAEKEHRKPLCSRALAILAKMLAAPDAKFVFPGGKIGKGLSNMAMTTVLRRMDRSDITVHGFRSTFRDWAAERTRFPSELAEMALAHAVGDKVEAAYRRGDMFEKRVALMVAWEKFCATPKVAAGDKVVHMRKG
jgi:integrase